MFLRILSAFLFVINIPFGMNGNTNSPTELAPGIEITGNTVLIPNGDVTPDIADGTDMGAVLLGNSVTQTFTIHNTNCAMALNITSSSITGDAEFSLGTVPPSISVGGTVTFDVTYTPGAVGANAATVNMLDDCGNMDYTFLLQGEGSDMPAETLNFDGSNDYCFANINSTTNFTMEAWINADPTAGGYRAVLVWQKTGPNHEVSLEVRGTGVVRFGHYDYGNFGWQQIYSTTNVKDGNCHHIAGVVEGNKRYLYINGVLEATLTINANNNSAENLTDLRIGNIQLNNGSLREHFRGNIDEVRIWGKALSCQEIINNAGCEITGSETGLLAYYDFNRGVADGDNPYETTLPDRTANGNDMALNNFALAGATSNWIEPGCAAPLAVCIPFLATMEVSGNGVAIANNDVTPDMADDTDFGNVELSSASHTFTIENSGATDLTVADIALSGAEAASFSIGNSLVFPLIIPAATSADFDITFSTACVLGPHRATVTIDNDDCDDSSFSFDIQGTAVDNTPPGIACKDITLNLDASGNVSISAADLDGGTTDNCSFVLTVSPNTLSCSNEGDNSVILTATDDMGNVSSCTGNVTINAAPSGFVR